MDFSLIDTPKDNPNLYKHGRGGYRDSEKRRIDSHQPVARAKSVSPPAGNPTV